MARITAGISASPLDIPAAIDEASDHSCGAMALFIGTVRSSPSVAENPLRAVVRLEYDVHPEFAEATLQEIAHSAVGKWDLARVVIWHRSGTCDLGEPTVVVACAAEHRTDALEACRWIIDEIKATVPVWKKEIYADGAAWVGGGP